MADCYLSIYDKRRTAGRDSPYLIVPIFVSILTNIFKEVIIHGLHLRQFVKCNNYSSVQAFSKAHLWHQKMY